MFKMASYMVSDEVSAVTVEQADANGTTFPLRQ